MFFCASLLMDVIVLFSTTLTIYFPMTFFVRFLAKVVNLDICDFLVELGHVLLLKSKKSQVTRAIKRSTLLETNKFVAVSSQQSFIVPYYNNFHTKF